MSAPKDTAQPRGVEDLLLPEGKTEKFIEDLERDTEKSARDMDRSFHVQQAMDELAAAKDAPRKVRAETPLSERREQRAFAAPVGGADTLLDAPKVRVPASPFGRDEPTVLTPRRRKRTWIPTVGGAAFFLLGALLIFAMMRPARIGSLQRMPTTFWLFAGSPQISPPLPPASTAPSATQEPTTSATAPTKPTTATPTAAPGATRPNVNE